MKRAKYIHEQGCDVDLGVPCTCEPPYPKPRCICSGLWRAAGHYWNCPARVAPLDDKHQPGEGSHM